MTSTIRRRLVTSGVLAVAFALPLTVFGFWLMRLFPHHPGIVAVIGWFILLPAGMTAELLHGLPFEIAWIAGLLAEALVLSLLLAAWAFLRRKSDAKTRSPRQRAIAVSVLLMANLTSAFVLIGYLEESRPPLSVPAKLVPGEIASAKRKIPSGVPIDFGQLTFARGRLFVASVIGLIEVDGAKVSAVYRWHLHSRIDGVWSGPEGQSLWLQQAVSSDLSTLDDRGWRDIPLPTPDRGYTRGDMLQGFRMAVTERDLWLSGGSTLWKWDTGKSLWEAILVPSMKSSYEPVEVYGAAKGPVVVRGANQMFGSGNEAALLKRTSDGKWIETKLDECCVKDLTALGDQVYFRNKTGSLIRVQNGKVEAISSPGRVEAIGASNGQLFVSVASVGVFSFDGDWKKLFDAPYPPGSQDYWTHLAAHDGTVALSITFPSDTVGKQQSNGLWVSVGSKLVKVEIPE